jgi:hypothetical protein
MTEGSTKPASTALRGMPMAAGAGSLYGSGAESRLRWVPLRLALFGMTMFAVGTVLLVIWADALSRPDSYGSFHALGLIHIFALGFVTSMVMAVLYQFIPASFHANVRGLRRAQVMSATYAIAVILFTVSLSSGAVVIAAVAGPLLAVAVGLFLSQMADVLIRARRRTPEGGFHITAFLSLTAVIVLGSLLATSLPNAWIGDPRRWLAAKIVLAVAGWLAMILVGVSYHTVRGLNGSSARPRLVVPTLCIAVSGVLCSPVLILIDAPPALRASAMALLLVASCLFAADVVHLVRHRATNVAAVTWTCHVLSAGLLVVSAAEGVIAMTGGVVWAAMAVCGFLLGVAPMAILGNGNRIIPVLIGNRYDGRGRHPLSAGRLGGFTMPAAIAILGLSWASLQVGIGEGDVAVIRAGALLLAATAACLGTTVVRQALAARREARNPRWTLGSDSTRLEV